MIERKPLLSGRGYLILAAYQRAKNNQHHYAECRGSTFGIAVNSDEMALQWQIHEFRAERALGRLVGDKKLPGNLSYVRFMREHAKQARQKLRDLPRVRV